MMYKDEQRDLIQGVLDLANIDEIKSTRQVESIFKELPIVKRGPMWNTIPNKKDISGFINLQTTLRQRLETIIDGPYTEEGKMRDVVVRGFHEDSVDTAHILARDLKGKPLDFRFSTWGKPTLFVDRRGNLQFSAEPFLTGVHSAMLFGLILLFTSDLKRNLKQCTAKREGMPCGKFYLKTKSLRVACSNECRRQRRKKQVAKKVEELRKGRKEEERKKRDMQIYGYVRKVRPGPKGEKRLK